MKERRTRALARAAGWPFPTCPVPSAPRETQKAWLRLYKRLRWAIGNEADVKRNSQPGAKLARLRREARLRGIEVALSLGQYERLVAAAVCAYCGAPLPTWGHALDRVDPDRGYTADNVVTACDTCNRVKADIFTYEQMLEIGQLLGRWRTEGRWTDSGRRRRGGRPRSGDLRREIELWNRALETAAGGQRLLPDLDGGTSGQR